MITDTFENLTEEIIKVRRAENAIQVDACILTFSHVILKYVLENFECQKLGDLFSSNGPIRFTAFHTKADSLPSI
jgi:hypothetical protein